MTVKNASIRLLLRYIAITCIDHSAKQPTDEKTPLVVVEALSMIAIRDNDNHRDLPLLKDTHIGCWREVKSKHPARQTGDCSNQLVICSVIKDLQRQDPWRRFHKKDISKKPVEGK